MTYCWTCPKCGEVLCGIDFCPRCEEVPAETPERRIGSDNHEQGVSLNWED